jgi:hypothetical protein
VKKVLLIVAFFVVAGAAQAQIGGSISGHAGINGAGGLESHGGLNPQSPILNNGTTTFNNVFGTNPGEFVPSTFATYKDAVADAKANANKQPLTLADIARQAQAEKKAAETKSAMVLEQNSDGKLVIADPKKQ